MSDNVLMNNNCEMNAITNKMIFLFQLVAQHGAEAERHLIRCLFSHVDFGGDGKSSGKDFHQVSFSCFILPKFKNLRVAI